MCVHVCKEYISRVRWPFFSWDFQKHEISFRDHLSSIFSIQNIQNVNITMKIFVVDLYPYKRRLFRGFQDFSEFQWINFHGILTSYSNKMYYLFCNYGFSRNNNFQQNIFHVLKYWYITLVILQVKGAEFTKDPQNFQQYLLLRNRTFSPGGSTKCRNEEWIVAENAGYW